METVSCDWDQNWGEQQNLEIFDTEQIEDHCVGEPELALQLGGPASQQSPDFPLLWDVILAGNNDSPHGIQAPPACPACHLCVFARQQGPAGIETYGSGFLSIARFAS